MKLLPKDGFAWGYKVCNVKQRMEQENITALEAFIRILDENKLIRKTTSNATNANAKIVIYFPAGEYVLHEEAGKNFPYDIFRRKLHYQGGWSSIDLAGDENAEWRYGGY